MSSYSSNSSLSPSRSLFSRSSSESLSTLCSEDLERQSYQEWKGGVCCMVEVGESAGAEAVTVLEHGCSVVLHGSVLDCITSVRIAMASAGYASAPLMVTVGHGSSLATISFLHAACDAGATHALLSFPDLPSSHIRQNRFITVNYMRRILDSSPIPIMLEASKQTIEELGRLMEHPNCFGIHVPNICSETLRHFSARTTSKDFLLDKGHAFHLSHAQPNRLLALSLLGATGCIIPPRLLDGASVLHTLARKGLAGDMRALLDAGVLQAKLGHETSA